MSKFIGSYELRFLEEKEFRDGALATLSIGHYSLKSEDYRQFEKKLQLNKISRQEDIIIACETLHSKMGHIGIRINEWGVLELFGDFYIKSNRPNGEEMCVTEIPFSLYYLNGLISSEKPQNTLYIEDTPFFKINAIDVDSNEIQITLDKKIELIKNNKILLHSTT